MDKDTDKLKRKTLNIAYIALFSAMLSGGKYILSFIPNIEIVSLLILVIATLFNYKICLPVTLIFCTLETIIYGFSTWVFTYFIYWNLFGIFASVLFYNKNVISIYAAIYVMICTIIFGVLSTVVDVIFAGFGGVPFKTMLKLYSIYYVRGIGFFVTHIISNFIIVLFLYRPLCDIKKSTNYHNNLNA
jgi:hypothetical protein